MNHLKYVLPFFLFFTSSGYACGCVGELNDKEAYKEADAVISGRVLDTKDTIILLSTGEEKRMSVTTLLIQDVFKKRVRDSIVTIFSGVGKGDCGYRFKEGENYLVFLVQKNSFGRYSEKVDKYYYTDICMGNKMGSETSTYLEKRKRK